ncbi:sodium:proton antiporter NhaD [Draconibacterium halophilum]|uniref:Sodium:proton antiporter n=1 Tax=Draconibacterium halophilum TaxID=2706887 RepID=A0A6C0REI8_9BACT|nr:sodium:proton antiporter NhaD [Draconibacterium halophilum]QIA08292.1 sodium:proton antiporter [Draconibacterium halophilum]
MFILMVVVFVLGYTAIALEHPLKVDKAASALIIGTLCWVVYVLGAEGILHLGFSPTWKAFLAAHPDSHGLHAAHEFIVESEIIHHLGEISEILFFLLGAMTIVEVVDQHEGFKIITDKIKTTNKVKLLWILSLLTFFMSALLDNLTTTIVLVALLRKLIDDKQTRWFFASMVILAANAGGAWSPIGDVTTIMLWIGAQVTAGNIIANVFLPSLVCMVVPLAILSVTMKGNVARPVIAEDEIEYTTEKERILFLILGVCGLLFVPVFKTATHLPPYMGMLLSLGLLWVVGEIVHKDKPKAIKDKLKVTAVLQRVDVPTVLFFLGILSAVAALQSAGHLNILATYLDNNLGNIYLIDLAIGVLSSVVDNVPLVAGAMGMYPIADAGAVGYQVAFVQDGPFWEFLAYTAGTGGSILIIGSAAGVAAMGLEKIDFIWYLKKISWLAFIGYLAGAATYYVMFGL